jgi:hypothetical protein
MFEEFMIHLQKLRPRHGYKINKVFSDGADWQTESGKAMLKALVEGADLILPLMSDDSIFTSFFSAKELRQGIERHWQEKTVMIPIILTTCWWEDTSYRGLEVLPKAGLPIFDSHSVKEDLLAQVVAELDKRLDQIQKSKLELEKRFKEVYQAAEALYMERDQHPEVLQRALPLYQEAQADWREGFLPPQETIAAKVEICIREIDFRHYALAAQDAFKKGDIETAFFNCKDALELRNDAQISKLFEQVSAIREEERLKHAREPFERHLKQAHEQFLKLQWHEAQKSFETALNFYESSFVPDEKTIRHKIEICRREHVWEQSLVDARQAQNGQQYAKAAHILTQAIQDINQTALQEIEHLIDLLRKLEHAIPFRDQRSNRWGYYDRRDQKILIAPKYNAAYPFHENLAGVKKWEKWGFIDIEGNEIIPFEYDFVTHFKEGKAEVYKGTEHYFINHKNQKV